METATLNFSNDFNYSEGIQKNYIYVCVITYASDKIVYYYTLLKIKSAIKFYSILLNSRGLIPFMKYRLLSKPCNGNNFTKPLYDI